MALSHKQQIFVSAYCLTFNASAAARLAGYSEVAARVTGHRLLTNANISAEIQRRVDELAMTAHESLVRLASIARGDIGEFFDISSTGVPSLNLARATVATRLIKKLKTKTRTYTVDDHLVTETDVELELYDAQDALALIGRHHGLFTDRVEHSGAVAGIAPIIIYIPDNFRDTEEK